MSRILSLRTAGLVAALALLMTLCGCGRGIADFPVKTQDSESSLSEEIIDNLPSAESETPETEAYTEAGEFYGSYLTMYKGHAPDDERGLPFIKVFHSYSQVEEYYNSTEREHIYARQFTQTMASFTDEFLAEHDVLALVIDEPSGYINHTAGAVRIYPHKVSFEITRHTPKDAPLLNTEYHLIFVAPAGSFSGLEDIPVELSVTEVIDSENNSTFDVDMFRMYNPEFTSFVYRADPLEEDRGKVVDAIDGYNDLVSFYDNYKDEFDLDSEFKDKIGTLYSWDICDRYILLAVIVPVSGGGKPEITELFVNNLQLYVIISAQEPLENEKADAGYLILCGIERRDLMGVDLGVVNLSIVDS